MLRIIKIFNAFIRGIIYKVRLVVFNKGKVNIGKRLRIFNNAAITMSPTAKLTIKNNLKISHGAVVSSVSKGEINIGNNVAIGRNNMIISHNMITIGDGTILAPNVMIYDHDHKFTFENGVEPQNYETDSISIGRNCWIGANTVILRGSKIGDNCIVGAGSVIKGQYEDGSVIVQKRETTIISRRG